jgi:hypothetical protein
MLPPEKLKAASQEAAFALHFFTLRNLLIFGVLGFLQGLAESAR